MTQNSRLIVDHTRNARLYHFSKKDGTTNCPNPNQVEIVAHVLTTYAIDQALC